MTKFIIPFLLFHVSITYSQSNSHSTFYFDSSDKALASSVYWAKNKALSFSHGNTDPVGFWYEAALPNREAFCVRDVSHQSIGAEILGLSAHNFNMVLKFCENISKSKNYATYWEINRYDKPAPVDYNNDNDFWYNLPANFDLIFSIKRIHNWTGDSRYTDRSEIKNFISLSLNEYVKEWGINSEKAKTRNRFMFIQNVKDFPENRFGNSRGIPTYYERGNMLSFLGIDLTASYIAALKAHIEFLKFQKRERLEIDKYERDLSMELRFLETFWWDKSRNAYKSIIYENKTFDYFSIGKDEAFLHFLLYFDVLEDYDRITDIINWYKENHDKLIIELKSYLPILFYQYDYPKIANQMIKDLCDKSNLRRDYPEISFTVIEHITRGLMGINANDEVIETMSRLEQNQTWASVKGVSIRGTKIGVKHFGKYKTTFENLGEKKIFWKIKFEGEFKYVDINKKRNTLSKGKENGKFFSYALVPVKPKEIITAVALQ